MSIGWDNSNEFPVSKCLENKFDQNALTLTLFKIDLESVVGKALSKDKKIKINVNRVL